MTGEIDISEQAQMMESFETGGDIDQVLGDAPGSEAEIPQGDTSSA